MRSTNNKTSVLALNADTPKQKTSANSRGRKESCVKLNVVETSSIRNSERAQTVTFGEFDVFHFVVNFTRAKMHDRIERMPQRTEAEYVAMANGRKEANEMCQRRPSTSNELDYWGLAYVANVTDGSNDEQEKIRLNCSYSIGSIHVNPTSV